MFKSREAERDRLELLRKTIRNCRPNATEAKREEWVRFYYGPEAYDLFYPEKAAWLRAHTEEQ